MKEGFSRPRRAKEHMLLGVGPTEGLALPDSPKAAMPSAERKDDGMDAGRRAYLLLAKSDHRLQGVGVPGGVREWMSGDSLSRFSPWGTAFGDIRHRTGVV